MPAPKFGITTSLLKDKEYYYLVSCGSTSAKVILEQRYRNDAVKKIKIAQHVKKIETRGIKFNSFYNQLKIFDVMAALITPKIKVHKMPLKALINPYINKSLNEKLSLLWWKDTLDRFEYKIRSNHLVINDIKFTSSDINKIRFSIVWLNHIVSFPRPLNIKSALLSNDAKHEFLKSGLNGLQKISKGNKIFIRNLFKNLNELESASFLKTASLDFAEVWFQKFTVADREKTFKALETLYFSGQTNYENYPIFYIFNKNINLDIKKIDWLYSLGYTKIKDIIFICEENRKLLEDHNTFIKLHQSFSKYKG